MCLAPEVLHILQYRLRVTPDDTRPIEQVGECFNDFFVRVKNLAEVVDICKGANTQCEETQLKQDLVQELISTIATKTLDETVQQCYAFEAARRTTYAIVSPSKSVCAASRYRREEKASNLPRSPAPLKNKCDSCTRSHPKNQCPATNTVATAVRRDTGARHHDAQHSNSSVICVVTRDIMTSAALNPRTKAVPPSRQGRQLRRPPSPLKTTRVPARGVFILPPVLRLQRLCLSS
ncbi:hypothetical protein E2C01_033810 [Portunus trituberculatus]|uniref:Uncharacterized protein n=1 Tax=Portunus trituberculatus TaxID=210409 RepID=A0A5B7F6N8_PORTR|nr:hypothetical protein [Portunus trituberculatus]